MNSGQRPYAGITPLKGRENYREWSFDIENVLVMEGYWQAIEGYSEEDKTPTTQRDSCDKKARAIICLSLDPSLKAYVVQTKTAKEAWDALATNFKDQGVNSWISILQELCSIKLEDYESMQQYVSAFMNISLRLSSLGKNIDDELLAALMLKGLPKEYLPMRMALENSNVEISSDLVKSKLLQDTEYGKSKQINPNSACVSKSHKNVGKPKCSHCGKMGHLSIKCWHRKENATTSTQ